MCNVVTMNALIRSDICWQLNRELRPSSSPALPTLKYVHVYKFKWYVHIYKSNKHDAANSLCCWSPKTKLPQWIWLQWNGRAGQQKKEKWLKYNCISENMHYTWKKAGIIQCECISWNWSQTNECQITSMEIFSASFFFFLLSFNKKAGIPKWITQFKYVYKM